MKDLDDPTNRDSVPAMLTPGEFVLNKEAVQMYGPIIEQMNQAGLAARANGNAAAAQHLNNGGIVGGLFDDDDKWEQYSTHIASVESSGYDDPYSIYGGANNHYVGKYQLGSLAIADGARILGMKKVPTREQVRQDPALQEKLFKAYTKANYHYLKNDPNFKKLSPADQRNIIGYAHNQGHGGAKEYMRTGIVGTDAFGTKGTKYFMPGTADSTPKDTNSSPKNKQQEQVVDVSPSAEADEVALMPGFEMPSFEQPQMYVPNLTLGQQAPDYIPSVTEETMKKRKQQPGHFNDGGLIGWLGDAIFGDEEERKRRAAALARRPGNRSFDPLQGYMGVPEQPAAPGGGEVPNITTLPSDPEVGGFVQQVPPVNNRIEMMHNRQIPEIPVVETTPPDMPVPVVTPDAVVNEQLSAKQQWDRLKSERDALPEGHPRRIELSNRMNQINVANAAVDPRAGITGAANASGIPTPPKVYSGRGEDGYYDEEERKFLLNEQLRQKQMQQSVTAPDAPGKPMVDAQVDALQTQLDSLGVPPESQGVGTDMRVPQPGERPNIGTPTAPGYNPEDMTAVPGIDTNAPDIAQQTMDKADPDLNDPRKESTSMLKSNPALAGKTVREGIDKHGETPSPELLDKPVQEVADAGAQAIAKDPGLFKNISGSLKNAFGDLFDSKELARMAVVFAGAMLTGASAGQALAYAGGMYMQRVDARAAQYDKLVLSGKYTPESLKVYRESQDLTDLVPVGVKPELTGDFETVYTQSGKKVVVQKAKVGDNTVYVDENGKQVNMYKLQNQSPEDRQAYIKEHRGNVENQLEEMRETFDVQDDFSKTDILPSTNAGKIMEWAVDNGVDPADLGGLVESAYHDAMNDVRQDGSRARDLVPYLNQLIIRQKVPGGSDLFKLEDQPEKGAPRYVDARKLQKLNLAASNMLKGMGHKGGTQDLANMFYTEAAKDWNKLPPTVKKQWNKRATDNVNGFYLFVEDMLLNN